MPSKNRTSLQTTARLVQTFIGSAYQKLMLLFDALPLLRQIFENNGDYLAVPLTIFGPSNVYGQVTNVLFVKPTVIGGNKSEPYEFSSPDLPSIFNMDPTTGLINIVLDVTHLGNIEFTTVVTNDGNTDSYTTKLIIKPPFGQLNNIPIITILGDNPQYVNQYDNYNDPGVLAQDYEDGDITGQVQVISPLDITTVGTQTIIYRVEDSHSQEAVASRTVIVNLSNTKPVISLIGDTVTVTQGTTFVDPGATAITVDGQNITNLITVTGTIDTSVVGTDQTITYNVTDQFMRSADPVTRNVIITSNAIPVITLNGGNITLIQGDFYIEPGASATDAEDGTVTVVINDNDINSNTAFVGTYTIEYTATDSQGNIGTAFRTVTVNPIGDPTLTYSDGTVGFKSVTFDTELPYVSLPGDFIADELGIIAKDGNGNDLSVTDIIQTGSKPGSGEIGTWDFTFIITDEFGNTSNTLSYQIQIVPFLERAQLTDPVFLESAFAPGAGSNANSEIVGFNRINGVLQNEPVRAFTVKTNKAGSPPFINESVSYLSGNGTSIAYKFDRRLALNNSWEALDVPLSTNNFNRLPPEVGQEKEYYRVVHDSAAGLAQTPAFRATVFTEAFLEIDTTVTSTHVFSDPIEFEEYPGGDNRVMFQKYNGTLLPEPMTGFQAQAVANASFACSADSLGTVHRLEDTFIAILGFISTTPKALNHVSGSGLEQFFVRLDPSYTLPPNLTMTITVT